MSDEWNNWDKIADQFETAVDQVVRKTAFDIQADAASMAPVDTGFLKNSIYVATWDASTYGQGGFGGLHQELLPEVDTPDEHEAIIGVGASYGEYVEFGTAHQSPQPYLEPAVDWARGPFEDALGKIEDKLKEIRGG